MDCSTPGLPVHHQLLEFIQIHVHQVSDASPPSHPLGIYKLPNPKFYSAYILTHLKRPWCWERLKVGGEGDNRGWDGWMASPTQWTWIWINSRSWWWTGRPGVLHSLESQRVGNDWANELNWIKTETLPILHAIYRNKLKSFIDLNVKSKMIN